MRTIPLLEAIYNSEDSDESGIFAISMVDRPAIKKLAVQLSELKEVALAEPKKKQLLGAILLPDFPIRRKDTQFGEYELFFSEATVEAVAHDYLKKFRQSNATLMHETVIEGVTLIESWIVEDTNKDKSAVYDMQLKKGSWVGLFQLSDEAWETHVENGVVKGFSVEGLFPFERRQTPQETIEQVKQLLKDI